MREDLIANKTNKIGEIAINKYGSTMKIIDYKNANDITILFVEHNHILEHKKYSYFKKGEINSPFDKTVFGIGYLGSEKSNLKDWKYIVWHSMMDRCYNIKSLGKNVTYKICTVCDIWHNFQTFSNWCDNNYYEINNEQMSLDKDILFKGNKVYSPETCIFVPQRINTLFIKCNSVRGECPIGVSWNKKQRKYRAYCNYEDNKQVHLGYYDTLEEAFCVYKTYKECYIKELADKYKNSISQRLYDAMYRYEVEITD